MIGSENEGIVACLREIELSRRNFVNIVSKKEQVQKQTRRGRDFRNIHSSMSRVCYILQLPVEEVVEMCTNDSVMR